MLYLVATSICNYSDINLHADGGIMVAPVGDYNQELIRIEKQNRTFRKETIRYVRFVPMIHEKNK